MPPIYKNTQPSGLKKKENKLEASHNNSLLQNKKFGFKNLSWNDNNTLKANIEDFFALIS